MSEFVITKEPLEQAIKTLQPFISTEETRYYLNGIFFEWQTGSDKMNMVATDGHKLCVMKVDISPSDDSADKIEAIVPTAALKTILQMLKSIGNEKFHVGITFNEKCTRMTVTTPDQTAEFKMIDGKFPDYRRAIPSEKPKFSIGLAKAQATEAIKAVKAHKGKEAMEWHMTDAASPLKLVGQDKLIVVMPCRTAFNEIDLRTDAA